jgi:hypothetical protein
VTRAVCAVAVLSLAGCVDTPDSAKALFEMRSKCAALAGTLEDRYRRTADPSNHLKFTNHYDQSSNRCYAEVVGIEYGTTLARRVIDAQEQNVLVDCFYNYKVQESGPTCLEDGKPSTANVASSVARANKLMAESAPWP